METRKTQIYLALSTTIILTSIWVLSMYESEAQIENFYKIISILNDKNLTDNQDFKNNKKIPPILEIFSKIRKALVRNKEYTVCIEEPKSYDDIIRNADKTFRQMLKLYSEPSKFTQSIMYAFGSIFLIYTYANFKDGPNPIFMTGQTMDSSNRIETVSFPYFDRLAQVLTLSLNSVQTELLKKNIPENMQKIMNNITGPLLARFDITPSSTIGMTIDMNENEKYAYINNKIKDMNPTVINTNLIPIIGYVYAIYLILSKANMVGISLQTSIDNSISACL